MPDKQPKAGLSTYLCRDYASQAIFHDKIETAYCYPFADASTSYGFKKNMGPTNDAKFTYRMSENTRFLLQDPWLRRIYRDKRFIWRANQLGQVGKTVRFPKLAIVPGF